MSSERVEEGYKVNIVSGVWGHKSSGLCDVAVATLDRAAVEKCFPKKQYSFKR